MPLPKPEPIPLSGGTLATLMGKNLVVDVAIVATPWSDHTEYGDVLRIPVKFLDQSISKSPYVMTVYPQTTTYHKLVEVLGEDEVKWTNAILAVTMDENRGRQYVAAIVSKKPDLQAKLGA